MIFDLPPPADPWLPKPALIRPAPDALLHHGGEAAPAMPFLPGFRHFAGAAAFQLTDLFIGGIDGALFIAHPDNCFTDEARTIAAGVGDAVAGMTDLSGNGRHWSQATEANRPILRQDGGGHYYLEAGVGQGLVYSGGNYTLKAPHYMAVVFTKKEQSTNGVLAVNGSSTIYHRLFNVSTGNRVQALFRGPQGQFTATSPTNGFAVDATKVMDSLAIPDTGADDGFVDLGIDNEVVAETAQPHDGTPLHTNASITCAGTVKHFYAGLVLQADPAADRAAAVTALGALAGLTV